MPRLSVILAQDNSELAEKIPDAETYRSVRTNLDRSQTSQEYHDSARHLSICRERGILIMGSGNMVHNLMPVGLEKAYSFYLCSLIFPRFKADFS